MKDKVGLKWECSIFISVHSRILGASIPFILPMSWFTVFIICFSYVITE
jgi:hypothetical protein